MRVFGGRSHIYLLAASALFAQRTTAIVDDTSEVELEQPQFSKPAVWTPSTITPYSGVTSKVKHHNEKWRDLPFERKKSKLARSARRGNRRT